MQQIIHYCFPALVCAVFQQGEAVIMNTTQSGILLLLLAFFSFFRSLGCHLLLEFFKSFFDTSQLHFTRMRRGGPPWRGSGGTSFHNIGDRDNDGTKLHLIVLIVAEDRPQNNLSIFILGWICK